MSLFEFLRDRFYKCGGVPFPTFQEAERAAYWNHLLTQKLTETVRLDNLRAFDAAMAQLRASIETAPPIRQADYNPPGPASSRPTPTRSLVHASSEPEPKKSTALTQEDWFIQEPSPDGLKIIVRQHKWSALKRSGMIFGVGIACALVAWLCSLYLDASGAKGAFGTPAFLGIFFGGLLALVCVGGGFLSALFALVIGLRRAPRSVFVVGSDKIVLLEKASSSYPSKMVLSDVSGIYRDGLVKGNERSETRVTIHSSSVAGHMQAMSHNAGAAMGQLVLFTLSETGFYVGVNHRGKKVDLVRGLSESEADHVYESIRRVLA